MAAMTLDTNEPDESALPPRIVAEMALPAALRRYAFRDADGTLRRWTWQQLRRASVDEAHLPRPRRRWRSLDDLPPLPPELRPDHSDN